MKKKKKVKAPRNTFVLAMLLSRKPGKMKHRTEGRGGARKRDWAEEG